LALSTIIKEDELKLGMFHERRKKGGTEGGGWAKTKRYFFGEVNMRPGGRRRASRGGNVRELIIGCRKRDSSQGLGGSYGRPEEGIGGRVRR